MIPEEFKGIDVFADIGKSIDMFNHIQNTYKKRKAKLVVCLTNSSDNQIWESGDENDLRITMILKVKPNYETISQATITRITQKHIHKNLNVFLNAIKLYLCRIQFPR